jgi:ArsR family transcriptional regulator
MQQSIPIAGPVVGFELPEDFDFEYMLENVTEASQFLKTLANPGRLLILCYLANGEQSVSSLEDALNIRQPTLSQQLAKLRDEGLVKTRREAKRIYYSLDSREAVELIAKLHELFCKQPD